MSLASPFSIPNVRLFIAFRVLFNARFYYPVFLILFTDMGLKLEQFFLLNAVWAATIVLMEVPSGAFADTFGRRNLLVLAGICMVLEMVLICFVPLGNATLLFWAFCLNRIISGAAEALASGADEALAFDSLKREGLEEHWPAVLDRQMRFQAAAFFFAMLTGAAVYDHNLVNWALGTEITRETSLRFPLYLTLLTSVICVTATVLMKEVRATDESRPETKSAGEAFRLVGQTGKWILQRPWVTTLIAVALIYDSVCRLSITMDSEYYRLIGIPEGMLGVMGSLLAVGGFMAPLFAKRAVGKFSPAKNFIALGVLILVAQTGRAFFIEYYGIVFAILNGLCLYFIGFLVSTYINRAVEDSNRRATVLSFRSLACNVGYGFTGLIYMVLTNSLRHVVQGGDEAVFQSIVSWLPLYFVLTALLLAWFSHWQQQREKARLAAANPAN